MLTTNFDSGVSNVSSSHFCIKFLFLNQKLVWNSGSLGQEFNSFIMWVLLLLDFSLFEGFNPES